MSIWLIIIFIYWSTITIVTLLLISVHTNNKENDEQVPWWFYMIIAILTPIIILCLIAYFFKLVYQYGWRLAWARIFHEESFDRWESIMRNKEERIDKELNGWPEDPMERAKCPRLQLWLDNQFECNDYIRGAEHSLVYVANEECPELEDLFEHHLDELNLWAAPMEINFVYLPSLFKTLQNEEVQSYKKPWKSDIPNKVMTVGNDYMFRFLIHPEDKERMKHGLFFCQSEICSDHYVKSYLCHYYNLVSPSEKDWNEQLEELRQRLYNEACWLKSGFNCTMKDTAGDDPDDYADNQFNTQKEWRENVDDLMDEIRERVEKLRQRGVAEHLLMELIHPQKKLSKMVITKEYRIFLTDYQNMEIKMEPLVKAVYLLFLNHPEGLMFKHLPDYREELTQIYLKLKPSGMTDRIRQSIEDVTNPLLNSINEKCARIRGAFVGQFDDWLAKHYYIDGLRGSEKKISLPRELVVWDE